MFKSTKSILGLGIILTGLLCFSLFFGCSSKVKLEGSEEAKIYMQTHADSAWSMVSDGVNLELAESILKEVRDLAIKWDNKLIESDCLSQLSTIYRLRGNVRKAVSLGRESLIIRMEIGEDYLIGNSYNVIALAYDDFGALDSAKGNYKSALISYEKSPKKWNIPKVENNLADLYLRMARPDSALDLVERSFAKRLITGDKLGISKTNLVRGNVYLELGLNDSAKNAYLATQKYAKEFDTLLYIKVSNNLLGLYLSLEDSIQSRNQAEALKLILNQTAKSSQNFQVEDIGRSYQYLGQTAMMLHNWDTATYYLDLAQKQFDTEKDTMSLVKILLDQGELLIKKKRYVEAIEKLKNARFIAKQCTYGELEYRSINDLAIAYEGKGDINAAYKAKKEAEGYADEMYVNYVNAVQKEKEIGLQIEKTKSENRQRTAFFIFLSLILVALLIIFLQLFIRYRNKVQISELVQTQQDKALVAMLEGQEKERSRIYIELHNQVGALFTLVKHPFEEGFEALNKELWDKLEKDLAEIQDKVRAISHENGQTLLAQRFFKDTITELCEQATQNSNITSEPVFDFEEERLNLDTRVKLHSVITELLNNAIKYSGAKHIEVNITEVYDDLNIMVIDDGVGFDQTNKDFEGHGIKINQAMIASLGGTCEYDSQLGRGTTVNIEIPIQDENN